MSLQQASKSQQCNEGLRFVVVFRSIRFSQRTPMLACLLACLLAALGFSEVHEISKKAASSWGL
jgi:hypothetical protein